MTLAPAPPRPCVSGFDPIGLERVLLNTLMSRAGGGWGWGCPPAPFWAWPQAGGQLSPQGGGLNNLLLAGWVDTGWGHLSTSRGGEKSVTVWPHLPL